MSSAHRPTWTPAMGKDARMNTKQYSSRDIAAHTKLKYRQPGQNSKSDIARRDLKVELELAERESQAKRRRAAGLLPIEQENQNRSTPKLLENENDEEESQVKRRKILQEALLADKDDSESEDDDSDDSRHRSKRPEKGKGASIPGTDSNGTHVDNSNRGNESVESDSDDDDDDDSDDDEAETAELMRELEKIKRERAEEKERQEREAAANAAIDKEAQSAVGNPLLNLKAALNQNGNTSPTSSVSGSTTSFSVKRRWDEDVIFKNQARDVNEKPKKEFVNDLLRTEFHRRFLKKFIA